MEDETIKYTQSYIKKYMKKRKNNLTSFRSLNEISGSLKRSLTNKVKL